MKKKTFIQTYRQLGMLLCASAFLLAGCSNEPEELGNDGLVALEVSSGIDVQTRAYDDKWEAGDAIGIYMLSGETQEAANKQYTTASTSATGAFSATSGNTIYFPIDGTKRDFIAYYPYRNLTNTTYSVDVSNQSSQKGIDLMGAAKVTGKDKNDPKVAFTFAHKLVKLALTIKPDGASLTAADMEGIAVKLTNQRTKATYDVVKGGSVAVDTQTDPKTIELPTAADGTNAEGIVLPNDDTKDMNLEFHLKDGSTYVWAVKDAKKSQRFVAGSKYVYTITISKTGLEVTSTVVDWTPGNEGGETGSAQ